MSEKTQLQKDLDILAQEGIACRVEGDNVVCTGENIEVVPREVRIPKNEFNLPNVREQFADKV